MISPLLFTTVPMEDSEHRMWSNGSLRDASISLRSSKGLVFPCDARPFLPMARCVPWPPASSAPWKQHPSLTGGHCLTLAQVFAALFNLFARKGALLPCLHEHRSRSSLTQSLLHDVLALSYAPLLVCFNNSTLGRSDNIIPGLILPLLY